MKIILRYYFSALACGFFASIFVYFKMGLFVTTFIDGRFMATDLGQVLLVYLSFILLLNYMSLSPFFLWTLSPPKGRVMSPAYFQTIATRRPVFWESLLSR